MLGMFVQHWHSGKYSDLSCITSNSHRNLMILLGLFKRSLLKYTATITDARVEPIVRDPNTGIHEASCCFESTS